MSGTQPIVLSHDEIQNLHLYAYSQSKARTFRIQRDTANVLHVVEPSGRLTRITPPRPERQAAS